VKFAPTPAETRIFLYTTAYNAERTLRRTIDSVLAQTYEDFTYYLLDNGSTDSTGDIVREYAAQDNRIIALFNQENYIGKSFYDPIYDREIRDSCYLCTLDADDEYAPDFLEKCLVLMERENLDIVACGTQFIYEPTGEKMNQTYAVQDNMTLVGSAFSKKFPEYLPLMFTIWGKLYPLSLLRKCDFEYAKTFRYGGDTAFALEAFSHAKRVGIIGGTLHKYYLSPKSAISNFDEKRMKSNQFVFKMYMSYLKKRNSLTQRNIDAIYNVYLNTIKSTTIVALGADIPLQQKLDVLYDIFTNEITRKMMDRKSPVLPEYRKRELNGIADNWIRDVTAQSPLTRDLPPRSALFLRIPISAILDNNIEAAETEIMRIANGDEIPDEHAEAYLKFAELICAASENADGWLFFKKLLARFLLDAGRIDEARAKLDELAELLPDDIKVLAMRGEIK
jgi:glycosyltransferase involved in cell wall biosynthesis